MPGNPEELTTLLIQWRNGEAAAGERFVESVYDELRRMADHYISRERSGHTLQATALVSELYLRLFGGQQIEFNNRAHFFAVAAQQMRRLLVDHARAKKAQKRGAEPMLVTLSDAGVIGRPQELDVLVINEALDELAQLDPRAASVVELRFFGGLTEAESAEVLAVSVTTIKREWEFARAWLVDRLQGDQ